MYKEKISKYKQEHLLRFFDELTKSEQEALIKQIEATDFSIIGGVDVSSAAEKVYAPLAAMELAEIESNKEQFTELGVNAISSGKVGAVLLAGGMGTRLGSDNPKGMLNVGMTRELFIFECLINNIMDVVNKAKAWIHLFIMTSDKNHKATVDFFEEHNYFGYASSYLHFFKQEMAPSTDYSGKIYLEEKWKLATSPNGNGGWFISLKNSGLLDLVHTEGIEWLNIFSVDNVLQHIADPCFIGAVIDRNCTVGSKVVRKASPDEKVGIMCLENGKPSIVEYYELTDAMKNTVDYNGNLAYNFGVILNYLFKVTELEHILENKLPLHKVEKRISYIDDNGVYVNPDEPNGYKYETLVLDMIHQMDSCLPFEVDRRREFAPIKNKQGVDSIDTARDLLRYNGISL